MADITTLLYFEKVAELQHMSMAAAELNISQSALSGHIRRLEDEVGIDLFDRRGKSISLNACGQAFLEEIRITLKHWERAKAAAQENAAANQTTITLAAPPFSSFPGLLQAIRQACPNLPIRNKSCTFLEAISDLSNGSLDLILTERILTNPSFDSIILKTEPVVLLVHSSHPLAGRETASLSEFKNDRFASCSYDSAISSFSMVNFSSTFSPTIAYWASTV